VGVTPGIIGTMEAAEAIKWIVGIGENLKNKLLIWDGDTMDFQKVEIKKDPDCRICGK
jgi:adenylyltransferase/sulfurtransferase